LSLAATSLSATMEQVRLVAGYACASCCETTLASAAAWATLTPGFSRPNTVMPRLSRFSSMLCCRSSCSRGPIARGTKRAERISPFEPVKCSGATPITVKGTLFRKMVLPMTSGFEAKSVRHNSCPRTTTASRPGTRSSSGRKGRPNSGGTSSTRKKSPLTNSPNFICGNAPFSVANPNCEYCEASNPV